MTRRPRELRGLVGPLAPSGAGPAVREMAAADGQYGGAHRGAGTGTRRRVAPRQRDDRRHAAERRQARPARAAPAAPATSPASRVPSRGCRGADHCQPTVSCGHNDAGWEEDRHADGENQARPQPVRRPAALSGEPALGELRVQRRARCRSFATATAAARRVGDRQLGELVSIPLAPHRRRIPAHEACGTRPARARSSPCAPAAGGAGSTSATRRAWASRCARSAPAQPSSAGRGDGGRRSRPTRSGPGARAGWGLVQRPRGEERMPAKASRSWVRA